MNDDVGASVRVMLAEALGREPGDVAGLPGDTPLFGAPLGVGSLSGVTLLAKVKERYGVDVVADDLTLASLESIDTLVGYIRRRIAS